jgi:flagellar hook-associated protein 1 FlgK
MSLSGALNIGRTAIAASQTAMQVTGQNLANAATEGYHRRSIHTAPVPGEPIGNGHFVGRGVRIREIRREVDVALQGRLRDAVSQHQGALIDQRFLTALEAVQNELSDQDVSSELSAFFSAFSELANNPLDSGARAVVIQQGESLASRLRVLAGDLDVVRREVDEALGAATGRVNDLLGEIAALNGSIADAEAGVGQANDLRDHRDLLIDELSGLLDITVYEHANGAVDIHVGSIPIMLAGQSRGVELRQEAVNGSLEVSVRVAADGTPLDVQAGQIGGLLRQRSQTIEPAIENVDQFTTQLIFQVNRVHAQGQGTHGYTEATGLYGVNDPDANLNSAGAALPFSVENGTFFVHVTHAASGVRTTHQIQVDGNADSLNDLIARINAAVPNATAATGPGGVLRLTAAGGFEISFSDDAKGALAALGLNTFFQGEGAADIAVSQALLDDPGLLAAGAGHVAGSNATALAMAALQDQPIEPLGNVTLRQAWRAQVNSLAGRAAAATARADSAQLVRESLSAQAQAISGVSIDDEAVNLLSFQRQFQAAARFISVIDEALQTLLSLV